MLKIFWLINDGFCQKNYVFDLNDFDISMSKMKIIFSFAGCKIFNIFSLFIFFLTHHF